MEISGTICAILREKGAAIHSISPEATVYDAIQTMADRIMAAAPGHGGKGREEGSLLGGIGRLLDGDNS